MEKLWSPWRSNYIESFKNKKDEESCVFCTAANESVEEENSLKVFSGKNCYVNLNLYPYNSGHVMVIPNRHLSNILDLTKEENEEIMDLIQLTVKAFNESMKPQGFNIGANVGKAAGAGIDQHLHFHIVPRWNGDTNFMPALGKVKVISQDLLETKRNLIAAYKKVLYRE